jgi:glycerophosphoryl diester phosphodiesterase
MTRTSAAPLEIIGHRGAARDAPENTLASIALAWKQEADGVEFDVRLTRDGRIVAIHDAETKRTAGEPSLLVAESTLRELRLLDVGWWKGEVFASQRIPTLEEVIAITPPGKRLFVEVKCGVEIIPELDRVLASSNLEPGQLAVISFDSQVIAASKAVLPSVPAYWIANLDEYWDQPPAADLLIDFARALGADGLDLAPTIALKVEFVEEILASGLQLYVWTVNLRDEARRMAHLKIHGITTDRPGWLREQLAR